MSTKSPRGPAPARPSRPLLALLLGASLGALSLPGAAHAQELWPFAVGAGGGAVNLKGSGENLESFTTGSAYFHLDVNLEVGAFLQARYTTAPNLHVSTGTLTVGYLFKEAWWRAGFYLGAGVYHFAAKDPAEGQSSGEPSQTVVGWTGGLLTTFQVARRWQARVDVGGHLIRDTYSSKAVVVSAGLAYLF